MVQRNHSPLSFARRLCLGLLATMVCWSCAESPEEFPDSSGITNTDVVAEPAVVDPERGSSSGYYPVRVDVGTMGLEVDQVTDVRFGSVRAIELRAEGEGVLVVTVQGHPEPGAVDVEVHVGEAVHILEQVFVYEPPVDPIFERVVAIGASLTQGVQRGTPSNRGTLMSPAAQVARQVGAYFPLPILVSDLFPQLEIEHIGPPPECTVASIVELATAGTAETMPKLQDPETGEIDFSRARADHELDVHNVAVGGSNLRDLIDRPPMSNIPVNFLTHLVYEPFGGLFDRITETQLDRVDALKPTLVFTTDLYGNDLIAPFVNADEIDASLATPLEDLEADLERVVARLAATGAYVFLPNLPGPSLLPATQEKRRSMLAAAVEGVEDPEEAAEILEATAQVIDAQIAEIEARADACNEALKVQVDRFPNVFLVDLAIATEGLAKVGMTVGDEHLTTAKFGGLLGLDGIHFSDTGYALVANLLINAINKELGVDVPYVDFAAVLAEDMESPKNLKAQGLDGSLCD